MNNMVAYPGKATLQLYTQMAVRNELATGKVQGPNRTVDLADVTARPTAEVAAAGAVTRGAILGVKRLARLGP